MPLIFRGIRKLIFGVHPTLQTDANMLEIIKLVFLSALLQARHIPDALSGARSNHSHQSSQNSEVIRALAIAHWMHIAHIAFSVSKIS